MIYRIKIEYCTGNSFGSNDEIRCIDLEWQDLNVAKQNLQRIDEHYKQYENISHCRTMSKKYELGNIKK